MLQRDREASVKAQIYQGRSREVVHRGVSSPQGVVVMDRSYLYFGQWPQKSTEWPGTTGCIWLCTGRVPREQHTVSGLTQLAEPTSLVKILLHIITTTSAKMPISYPDKMSSAQVEVWNTKFFCLAFVWMCSVAVKMLCAVSRSLEVSDPPARCLFFLFACPWCWAVYMLLFGPLSAFPWAGWYLSWVTGW